MILITLTCPKCGAQMEVNPELEAIICNYCGNKMLIDREVVEQKITGGFEFGYQQEQGRLKAQQEEQQKRIREEEKEARKQELKEKLNTELKVVNGIQIEFEFEKIEVGTKLQGVNFENYKFNRKERIGSPPS